VRCFRHVDRDAVAICTHCTKGLCSECARDVPGGTACGDACAEAIALAERVLRRSDRNISLQRQAPRFLGVFLMVVGLFFIAWGLALPARERSIIVIGAIFSLAGLGAYWIYRRFPDVR
jgi:hypothetical protein